MRTVLRHSFYCGGGDGSCAVGQVGSPSDAVVRIGSGFHALDHDDCWSARSHDGKARADADHRPRL